MSARSIVVISAGVSQPSSTRLLADRLAQAVSDELAARGRAADVRFVEVRELAPDVVNMTLTGFASAPLAADPALDRAEQAGAQAGLREHGVEQDGRVERVRWTELPREAEERTLAPFWVAFGILTLGIGILGVIVKAFSGIIRG